MKRIALLFVFFISGSICSGKVASKNSLKSFMQNYIDLIGEKRVGKIPASKNFKDFLRMDLKDFSICRGKGSCKVSIIDSPMFYKTEGKEEVHVFIDVRRNNEVVATRSGCYILSKQKNMVLEGYLLDCDGK